VQATFDIREVSPGTNPKGEPTQNGTVRFVTSACCLLLVLARV
jgi:hypothetical protein